MWFRVFVFALKDSVDINISFALLLFSIIISTILTIILSAALLTKYNNIKKDICYIQRLNQVRMLSNGENTNRKERNYKSLHNMKLTFQLLCHIQVKY
jgi:anaerobic C4-dicarboxylate transporter